MPMVSGLQPLTSNDARNFDPAVLAGRQAIVFASDLNSPGFSEIYTMTSSGRDITQLTDVPNSYSPTVRRTGPRSLMSTISRAMATSIVMDADGQRPTLLTIDDNGAEDHSPAWSPDGRWILFASNRDGSDQFRWYAIDMQGNAQPVTVTGRSPQSLTFVTQ